MEFFLGGVQSQVSYNITCFVPVSSMHTLSNYIHNIMFCEILYAMVACAFIFYMCDTLIGRTKDK